MNNQKGLLVVLSAPSGCGKDTVAKEICKLREDCYISVSATTRGKRTGEEEGKDYFFKTKAEFEQMIKDGGFLEYAQFADNYYGTPVSEVEKSINNGKICILIIEVNGAENIMKKCPDCISIFLLPPSEEVLEKRLRGRSTDSEESIAKRLLASKREMLCAKNYKYNVVNDALEDAVNDINKILCNELKNSNAN